MNLLAFLMLLVQAAQGPLPDVVRRSHLDRSRGVDFHALVSPETVYVGQQATYELGVFIDGATRQRLRRNPEFVPPESRAMLAYDLPDKTGGFTGTIDGRAMEVHVFRRALFPLTPGRYDVPEARLNYALPQSASFFSREETFTLRSENVAVVAVPIPAAGRPDDWAGAVGNWRASARVDSAPRRPGEPFVLTLRVEGQGNVTLLPRPALEMSWASVVAAEERVRLDSSATLLRGAKEFDWLVTPREGGRQSIPAIRYTFFNPYSRRYEVATSDPIAVRAVATALDSAAPAPVIADSASTQVRLPLRPTMGGESAAPLGDSLVVRLLFLLAPFPAFGAWWARRPKRAGRAATSRERLANMAGSAVSLPADVRLAFLATLTERMRLDPAALARPGAWERALRREGVTAETAAEVAQLLDALDAASFDGESSEVGRIYAPRARDLAERVDKEARRGWRAPRAAAFVALIVLAAVAAVAAAAADDRATQAFAEGLSAYGEGDAVRAAHRFADAARLAPRAADAWANAGTASWAAADTAGAVAAWQRALRLDPLATDMRERLALVRAPQESGSARVSNLPPRPVSLLALLVWFAGWGVAARLAWRRRSAWRLALLTSVAGGALAAVALLHERDVEGRQLAVVAEASPMRALPALGAEAGATPLLGEVGRIEQRQGVWVFVRLDANRAGWLPSASVLPIGRD